MRDIVERLRLVAVVMGQAADEIERLATENETLRLNHAGAVREIGSQDFEIARLRESESFNVRVHKEQDDEIERLLKLVDEYETAALQASLQKDAP